jgi:hypothetical protein
MCDSDPFYNPRKYFIPCLTLISAPSIILKRRSQKSSRIQSYEKEGAVNANIPRVWTIIYEKSQRNKKCSILYLLNIQKSIIAGNLPFLYF